MQSTNVKEIKVALWDQAFRGCVQVHCPMGRVVAIRRRKGQLLALIRGWGRWYPVESVTIDVWFAMPFVNEQYSPRSHPMQLDGT